MSLDSREPCVCFLVVRSLLYSLALISWGSDIRSRELPGWPAEVSYIVCRIVSYSLIIGRDFIMGGSSGRGEGIYWDGGEGLASEGREELRGKRERETVTVRGTDTETETEIETEEEISFASLQLNQKYSIEGIPTNSTENRSNLLLRERERQRERETEREQAKDTTFIEGSLSFPDLEARTDHDLNRFGELQVAFEKWNCCARMDLMRENLRGRGVGDGEKEREGRVRIVGDDAGVCVGVGGGVGIGGGIGVGIDDGNDDVVDVDGFGGEERDVVDDEDEDQDGRQSQGTIEIWEKGDESESESEGESHGMFF